MSSGLPDGFFITLGIPAADFAEAHMSGDGKLAIATGLAKSLAVALTPDVLAGLASGKGGKVWMSVRILSSDENPFEDPEANGWVTRDALS
jgi:hypothetical protein